MISTVLGAGRVVEDSALVSLELLVHMDWHRHLVHDLYYRHLDNGYYDAICKFWEELSLSKSPVQHCVQLSLDQLRFLTPHDELLWDSPPIFRGDNCSKELNIPNDHHNFFLCSCVHGELLWDSPPIFGGENCSKELNIPNNQHPFFDATWQTLVRLATYKIELLKVMSFWPHITITIIICHHHHNQDHHQYYNHPDRLLLLVMTIALAWVVVANPIVCVPDL